MNWMNWMNWMKWRLYLYWASRWGRWRRHCCPGHGRHRHFLSHVLRQCQCTVQRWEECSLIATSEDRTRGERRWWLLRGSADAKASWANCPGCVWIVWRLYAATSSACWATTEALRADWVYASWTPASALWANGCGAAWNDPSAAGWRRASSRFREPDAPGSSRCCCNLPPTVEHPLCRSIVPVSWKMINQLMFST